MGIDTPDNCSQNPNDKTENKIGLTKTLKQVSNTIALAENA